MLDGKRPIRVTIVGDQGVGKTSLIASLIRPRSETSFREKVSPKIPPVLWSPYEDVDGVKIELVDTSSKPSDQHQVDQEIQRADFLFLLYDINIPLRNTLESFLKFWIPRITHIRPKMPMALIGTKRDKRDKILFEPFLRGEEMKREMHEIISNYDQVEYLVECSVREPESLLDIQELLLLTQTNVLYPRMPLCDQLLNFKPEFVCALKRIFQIIDRDKDGFVDQELAFIQAMCFKGAQIECGEEEVNAVKEEIRLHNPNGVVAGRGINEAGFVSLFHLILIRGRTDTVWNILRHFGYNHALQLADSYFTDSLPLITEGTVELSAASRDWLQKLFYLYANGETLTWQQMEKMFALVPDGSGHPWHQFGFPHCCETGAREPYIGEDESSAGFSSMSYESDSIMVEHEPVTLRGFLGTWEMMVYHNWRQAFKYLCYLGIREESFNYLDVLPFRDRTCFFAYVVGPRKSGKTSVIRSVLGKEFQPHVMEDEDEAWGVTDVTIDKKKYHVVLKELSGPKQKELWVASPNRLKHYDLIICVYSEREAESVSESLKLCSDIRTKSRRPILFVATKNDLVAELPINRDDLLRFGSEPICISNKIFSAKGLIERRAIQTVLASKSQPSKSGLPFMLKTVSYSSVAILFLALCSKWLEGSYLPSPVLRLLSSLQSYFVEYSSLLGSLPALKALTWSRVSNLLTNGETNTNE